MYRSEDIGARKQSAGRRVGKNFRPRCLLYRAAHTQIPSPMESCPWQGCVFSAEKKKFFFGRKKKVPDEKIFRGISVAGLRKNSKATMYRSGDMGRLEKTWPGRRSAGGGGRRQQRGRALGVASLFPMKKISYGISVAGLRKNF